MIAEWSHHFDIGDSYLIWLHSIHGKVKKYTVYYQVPNEMYFDAQIGSSEKSELKT